MSTKEMTLLLVQASTRYREDFHGWLTDNYHVWERFKAEANKIRGAGWDRYSARTIIEVLRHESNLRDVGGRWKLNDWYTPDLARLYIDLDSTAAGFFELRARWLKRLFAPARPPVAPPAPVQWPAPVPVAPPPAPPPRPMPVYVPPPAFVIPPRPVAPLEDLKARYRFDHLESWQSVECGPTPVGLPLLRLKNMTAYRGWNWVLIQFERAGDVQDAFNLAVNAMVQVVGNPGHDMPRAAWTVLMPGPGWSHGFITGTVGNAFMGQIEQDWETELRHATRHRSQAPQWKAIP